MTLPKPVVTTDGAVIIALGETIVNRLDLICCILLLAVAVAVAIGVCYIIYKVIDNFMTY